MKIAMIASTYPRYQTDGAARFNHSLAEALTNLGHEVHVVIPHSPLINPFATPVNIHVFRYIWPARLSLMGYAQAMRSDRSLKGIVLLLAPFFFLMGLLTLWRIVTKYKIDVIHAHWVIPNGVLAALVSRLTGRPLFISLHGSDIFFARQHQLLGTLAAWTFKQAQGVTACSPELYAGALALQATVDKLHLLPWGADPALFNHRPDQAKCLRAQFGISAETCMLMGLGRLVGKKGFVYLLEALAQLRQRVPDVRAMIVGDGPERDVLSRKASELGIVEQVIFIGTVEWVEVPRYLALADIFVAPSIHDNGNVDGLPTVILEAMAAGKPIVASNVGGISLVVQPGKNGFLVTEKDVPALVNHLADLLTADEMRIDFGAKSRRLVEEQFNWRNVALSFEAMYRGDKMPLAIPFKEMLRT